MLFTPFAVHCNSVEFLLLGNLWLKSIKCNFSGNKVVVSNRIAVSIYFGKCDRSAGRRYNFNGSCLIIWYGIVDNLNVFHDDRWICLAFVLKHEYGGLHAIDLNWQRKVKLTVPDLAVFCGFQFSCSVKLGLWTVSLSVKGNLCDRYLAGSAGNSYTDRNRWRFNALAPFFCDLHLCIHTGNILCRTEYIRTVCSKTAAVACHIAFNLKRAWWRAGITFIDKV